MSRLTEFQVRSMIMRLVSAAEIYQERGLMDAARKRLDRAAEYWAELEQLKAMTADQRTERDTGCRGMRLKGLADLTGCTATRS